VADALNSALLTSSVNGAAADSTAEVQALADAYGRILNDNNPVLTDYQALGVSLGGIALSSEAFGLYNTAVLAAAPAAVDSIAELNALASVVNRLMLTAQGATPSPALTAQDLALLGLQNVDSSNLARILTTVDSSTDNGSAIASLSALQSLVNDVNGALGIITAYAQNNGGTAPTESSFAMAGISGVTASNLVAMQSALLAASVQAASWVKPTVPRQTPRPRPTRPQPTTA
jgi:hypothetical protein